MYDSALNVSYYLAVIRLTMGKIRSVRLGGVLEELLERVAGIEHKSASEAIREAVEEWVVSRESTVTLDVALKDFIGCVEGNGTVSGRNHHEAVLNYLEEKKAAGHL